ncbi:ATP-binding protein [Streptomyces sp. AC536]|uniref:ATP-binding protein n=1 Tax=Streptomyces buecherae TaxID=2763006 RepID=UPI00164D3150|nr:ATP-binding protein [Streptomyces buecherae]MBC3986400.1 ATP-binding protein [Streptomyces buecherae]QNJ41488.1 ATP-binding protein [Streptomyces buecherae]
MLEIVTVSALTAFLTAVGNGAAGEFGRQLHLSTGALVRRTLGRETQLPAAPQGWQELAHQLHPALLRNAEHAHAWASLLHTQGGPVPVLRPGPGLPPATRHFTDRDDVLKRLRREATRAAAGQPRAALLYGPPGIGTSAVALYFGADQGALFPDGRFYVDLRDASGGSGVEPAAVVGRLLRTMGVEAEQLPPTEAGRVQLYRSLTAGCRALVLVDHVTTAAQIRHLVPATPELLLLAVSSGPDLVVEAERIAVPPLRERDAVKMLRKVAGPEAVAQAKPRLPGVLASCAGNPFALKIAAMRLLTEGSGPAGGAGGTGDEDAPAGSDPVWATAHHAYRRLRPETARLCRLTALGDWPAIDAALAARAAGVELAEAGAMLAEAAEEQVLDASYDGRFRFRPGVRGYLEQAAGAQDGPARCSAAVARTLDGLRVRALYAARAALPQSWRTDLAPGDENPYADEAAGLAALRAEAANLVRAVRLADEYQHVEMACELARALWPVQLKLGYWDEALPALRIAARLVDAYRPETRMAGALHFQLAHCLGALERWEEADRAASAAVASERAAGHLLGEASCVEMRGLLRLNRWSYEAAYEHFVRAERVYRRIGPGQEGAGDLGRALALAARHQGRALRGMGRLEESRVRLERARDFFAGGSGAEREPYNEARALTDLAETLLDGGDTAAALAAIAEAERLLTPQRATPHLRYLDQLRRRCQAVA